MNRPLITALALLASQPWITAAQENYCPYDPVVCAEQMKEQFSKRGWVGINMNYDRDRGETIVTNVVANSPAQRAGIKVGDLLRGLNGIDYTVRNEQALKDAYERFRPGEKATFLVKRRGKRFEIEVRIGRIPDDQLAEWVGQHLRDYHQISNSGTSPEPPEVREVVSHGTCFVIGPDGQILTADHVVSGADEIRVSINGSDFISADLEVASPFNDLALLKIDVATPLYLGLAPTRSAETGQQVFTMGFPVTNVLGDEPKFTEGSISSTSGPGGEASLLQISVPVQPGNSGGPLVTFSGEVIGIVTSSAAIVPFLKAAGTLPQNVNWAVSADYARPMFEQPAPVVAAQSREESIERTKRALCQVEATRD